MFFSKILSLLPDTFSSLFTAPLGILFGIFGIGFLIGFHELGHFLFAKAFGIGTPSFSIGFGPQIISKKIGNTQFSLSAIPFGGYVELAGASEIGQGKQLEAHSKDEHSFATRPFWQQALVMLGGICFNLLFAYTVFILLFSVGLPKSKYLHPLNAVPIVADLVKGGSAEKAGIRIGDTIVSINETSIDNDASKILSIIRNNPDTDITIGVKRSNKANPPILKSIKNVPVKVKSVENLGKKVGTIGFRFMLAEGNSLPFTTAIRKGISLTNTWIRRTWDALIHLFSTRKMDGMGGPLMIISETAKEGGQGIKHLLIFLAIISINLAVFNLIPLPILDGGQLVLYGIEALMGRGLPERLREYIQIGCWILVLSLLLYTSYNDVMRLFGFK